MPVFVPISRVMALWMRCSTTCVTNRPPTIVASATTPRWNRLSSFFSAGEFFGFGFSVGIDFDGSWRLIDVFGDSPADLQGLIRTDTIIAVDGTPTSSLNLNSESTFGPSEAGVTRTLTIRSLDNTERDVNLTKQTVGLDPVPADRVKVFDVAGRNVGYLFFRTFIEDADDLLRAAIADLSAAGIDDLVLDLRYNGGGLVDTAETLGGLMVGPGQSGNLFFTYRHNSNLAAAYDEMRFFPLEADGLPVLENVYYLTDAGTASASELVISGVEPYMTRSVTLGARTYGKPVGQWGLEYCNESMILFLVTFRSVNSVGEADYYDGIEVDCAAEDDWDHELSDPEEGRLQAALDYIETGGSICTPPPVMTTMSLSGGVVFPKPEAIQGIDLAGKLLNAH